MRDNGIGPHQSNADVPDFMRIKPTENWPNDQLDELLLEKLS
jgi:hypothetical protein